jgi:hypothetical protein
MLSAAPNSWSGGKASQSWNPRDLPALPARPPCHAPPAALNHSTPPAGRNPAALASGKISVPEPVAAGELVAFETSSQAIDFRAEADAEFVLGSAVTHPYELALGYYSVHTSPASLQAGEQRIAEIKERLQKEGRL